MSPQMSHNFIHLNSFGIRHLYILDYVDVFVCNMVIFLKIISSIIKSSRIYNPQATFLQCTFVKSLILTDNLILFDCPSNLITIFFQKPSQAHICSEFTLWSAVWVNINRQSAATLHWQMWETAVSAAFREQLEFLVEHSCVSVSQISVLLGVSSCTIKQHLSKYGISVQQTYSSLSDV